MLHTECYYSPFSYIVSKAIIDLLDVINREFIMPKGGAREGSGRKPKWSKESRDSGMISCRFPKRHLAAIKEVAETLEAGGSVVILPSGYSLYSRDYIESMERKAATLRTELLTLKV